MKALTIGVPMLFEDEYVFDKSVLDKCKQYESLSPNFTDVALEIGNAGSTALNESSPPHTWPELEGFVTHACRRAFEIFDYWRMDYDEVSITKSWVNRHSQGGWTNWHTHGHCHLAIAAYVSAPKGSGNLLLVDPTENYWFHMPTKIDRANEGIVLPAETNKMYLFAPFLRHGTEKNNTNEDRWVISMNISCRKTK